MTPLSLFASQQEEITNANYNINHCTSGCSSPRSDLGIMAIGVYITFRILDIADLTVDGTMCTGGAVCIMMMLSGHNVWISMLAATLAGMLAGLATGIFTPLWEFPQSLPES